MTKHWLVSSFMLLCAPGIAQAQPAPGNPGITSPPPSAQPALPPQQVAPPAQIRAAPATGQWVYTQQYGWLWMPYGDQYVQIPATTQTAANVAPMEYVYQPVYGWTWLSAPWIWGWGPELYFSVGAVGHFGWYHPRAVIGRAPAPVVRGEFGFGHFGGGHFGGGHFGGRR